MTTTPVSLQDLRRKIYAKAKAEPHWRFWGLYVHVCKRETLRAAYAMAKENDGAPGSDGVTFEAIEAQGVEGFLEQIRDELITRSYVPLRARKKEIPKDGEHQDANPFDSLHSRPRGAGCAEADSGADFRGGLPTGVVRLSSEALSSASGNPGRRRDCAGEDASHRH